MGRDERGFGSFPKFSFASRQNGSGSKGSNGGSSVPPQLPASLGIGSTTDGSQGRTISNRPKFLPQPKSSPMAPSQSSDGLRFSLDSSDLPRTLSAHAQVGAIPTWSSQASSSRRAPIPGVPINAKQVETPASQYPSRNFLVPIGATGARQKLSIANATRRRRQDASEESHWSTDSSEGSAQGSTNLSRSHSQAETIADYWDRTPSGIVRSISHNDMSAMQIRDRTVEPEHLRTRTSRVSSEQHIQQAALERLSSQRVLPASRSESNLISRTASPPSQRSSSDTFSRPLTPPRSEVPVIPGRLPVTASYVSLLNRFEAQNGSPEASQHSISPVRPPRALARSRSNLEEQLQSVNRSPTVAETYKQSMLDNDRQATQRTASPVSHAPPQLDVQLPDSTKLFGGDENGTHKSLRFSFDRGVMPASVQHQSGITDEVDIKRLSTLSSSKSDYSAGSYEGAYEFEASAPSSSLQSSIDEALRIQNRFSLQTASNSQDSYLAKSDDEKPKNSVAAAPSTPKASPRLVSTLRHPSGVAPSPPRPMAGIWDIDAASIHAAADTPAGNDTMIADEAKFQPIEPRSTPKTPPTLFDVDTTKPTLPHVPSFKTLSPSPQQSEPSPDPKEGAALEAAAIAASPELSPRSMLFPHSTSSPLGNQSPPANSTLFNPNIFDRDPIRPSAEASQSYRSAFDGQDEIASWKQRQEAYVPISPLRGSRFSEASTIRSDSVTLLQGDDLNARPGSASSSDSGTEVHAHDGHNLPTTAWTEAETALRRFRDRSPAAAADRGNILRGVLLPFLALEAETPSVDTNGLGRYTDGKQRRALFFDWIRYLLLELQHVQTSADRGAILESIACIIESRNFSVLILAADPEDEARFSSVFGHILSYAIGELNKKGVYQNTLIFSGRLLAVAFFRVGGVASKLLRALPVNRFALERVAGEIEWKKRQPKNFARFAGRFPASLQALCFKDSRSYLKMLDNEIGQTMTFDTMEDDRFLVRQPEVEVEMSGNWLRRWQSDDSELFFSFCRSYHRQLANHFASSKSLSAVSKYFFGSPGYAHLATCVHQKCLALVHRVILSVTTLSSQKNFNPAGETANVFSGSTAGKPRILEAANRRCTAIVVDIVRAPAGSNMLFAPMLGLHIKVLVKRTSLYDVQGVFCLLDWLDGVLIHMESADILYQGLVDVSFIIETIGRLLETADHALALMRTIAFCYANFGVLTATVENRIAFCEQILLKPPIFNKLFLSWSFTIRAYYLHLLVFRLARVADFPKPRGDSNGLSAVRVVRLFNQRLEDLRRRHDELSPDIDSSSDGGQSEDSRSRKSVTSTFVSTIKHSSSSEFVGSDVMQEAKIKTEKLALTPSKAVVPISTTPSSQAKTASAPKKKSTWLKSFRSSSKSSSRPSSAGGQDDASRTTLEQRPGLAREHSGSSSNGTTPRTSYDSNSEPMSDTSTLAGSIRAPKGDRAGPYEFDIKKQQQQHQSTPPRQLLQQYAAKQSSSKPSPTREDNGAKGRPPALVLGTEASTTRDVFDLQSVHSQLPSPGHMPESPRISRAFSRRASMLPAAASELVAGVGDIPPVPELPTQQQEARGPKRAGEQIYPNSLHIYAVQSLREYEQTVLEHDDFFAAQPKDQTAQVPRLPVTWPAMWSSTGE